jgi:hypothetical protein
MPKCKFTSQFSYVLRYLPSFFAVSECQNASSTVCSYRCVNTNISTQLTQKARGETGCCLAPEGDASFLRNVPSKTFYPIATQFTNTAMPQVWRRDAVCMHMDRRGMFPCTAKLPLVRVSGYKIYNFLCPYVADYDAIVLHDEILRGHFL